VNKRVAVFAGIVGVTGALVLTMPVGSAAAQGCAAKAWDATSAYVGGTVVSYDGHQYTANWWSQGHRPDRFSGQWQEWRDDGSCTTRGPLHRGAAPVTCDLPAWAEDRTYKVGDRVSYRGSTYEAQIAHTAWRGANWNPVDAASLWRRVSDCGGSVKVAPQPTSPITPRPPSDSSSPKTSSGGFVVTEAQFNQMFPSRNRFYTYAALTAAMPSFPAFAKTGSGAVREREAAAFLANTSHETGGLRQLVEAATSNYANYCDMSQSYGCPAGQGAYYGRGPIQLSWNYNYKAAGDALGINLLADPGRVSRDPVVAWKTALWFWMTSSGAGTMTPHNAMVGGKGFAETVRSINGALECDGRNPTQVQSRVNRYKQFTKILGVDPGGNLSC
jgi:chitodextrinase/predicted chitinase